MHQAARDLICAYLSLLASFEELKIRLNDCNDLCYSSLGKRVLFPWLKHTVRVALLQEGEQTVGAARGLQEQVVDMKWVLGDVASRFVKLPPLTAR